MEGGLNPDKCKEFINKIFDESVVPSISKFIEIPNLSRSFDPEWATNGLLQKAANHIKSWVEELGVKGLKTQVIKDQGYTPIIFTEIAGDIPQKTIFFYGHFDKQPPFTGWHQGKGPTIPIIENGKLYGRGGADDGYSTYSSMLAIKAVQQQGITIPRIIMITEGDEESGNHVDHYITTLAERIGNPCVIFCLDSGTLDYDHMWLTSSLRGYVIGTVKVQVLNEGVHSGDASGVVPSAYRVANMLINRIQNNQTGEVNKKFEVNIPAIRYTQTYNLVQALGQKAVKNYPFIGQTHAVTDNLFELVVNRSWKPQLTVIGCTGLPEVSKAGNVSLPEASFRLSLRLPPTAVSKDKAAIFKQLIESNTPYGAKVTVENIANGNGWNSPDYQEWLDTAIKQAAQTYFGKPIQGQGQGGSIPLMGLLSELWPKAQFLVTGVLGPESNAHGPNQFMHIEYTKKLTQAMAHIVSKTAK